MRFPNAYTGVKKIFSSSILNLIAFILMAVGLLGGIISAATLAAAADNSSDALGVASLFGAGIFGIMIIASVVLMIIAYIMMIIGVNTAKQDDSAFSTAMMFIFVELICAAVSSLSIISPTLSSILSTVGSVAGFAVTLFIIQGIRNLADRLNRGDISAKGATIFKTVAVMYIINIIASVVTIFAPVAADYLKFAAYIIRIVIYFAFLSYLSQAKKMLK